MNDNTKIDPKRTALLVMDYQPGILAQIDDAEALTSRAREAIAAMREAGATIGYVRVAFEDEDFDAIPATSALAAAASAGREAFHADAPTTQVDERVAPEPGDIVVRKVRVGPFLTTDLAEQLAERAVDTLVLAGISTSGVLLSTVRDAHDRDFRLLVLADACADREPEVHEFLLERIVPRQAEVIEVAALAERLA